MGVRRLLPASRRDAPLQTGISMPGLFVATLVQVRWRLAFPLSPPPPLTPLSPKGASRDQERGWLVRRSSRTAKEEGGGCFREGRRLRPPLPCRPPPCLGRGWRGAPGVGPPSSTRNQHFRISAPDLPAFSLIHAENQ